MSVRRRGTELLQRLDLRPGPDVPWESLSKGNRQKVIIAQAFLGDCDTIILDESFGGLDDGARGALEDLIDEVLATGTSVLTSGPEMDVSERSDHTYRLDSGSLVEVQPSTQKRFDRAGRVMRVELTRTIGSGHIEEVCQVEGVLNWDADPSTERLVLQVTELALGSVLRRALDKDWFVEVVEPHRDPDR
jgi:ABC-type multidrug transport system ATPase subunit